jgi:Cu/Ag efflux protein CusF
MKTSRYSVAVAAILTLASWTATAQDNAECPKSGTPQQIQGRITNIDAAQGKVTVKSDDGKVHVFNASQDTLKDYKNGDTIKMMLRCGQ